MGCGGSKGAEVSSAASEDTIISKSAGVYYATGAAVPEANGHFVRDGTYQGAPLFKNGQLWLLRVRLPSGCDWWYIADKDKLDVNDGDLYRVKSSARWPPTTGWGLAKDGVAPAPTLQPFKDVASAPSVPPPAAQPRQRRKPKLGADGQEMAQNFEDEEIPGAYLLSGAAIPQANGVYARDGSYSGAPLFKNGQLWLLRYTMPSGARFWYVADKDMLDRDDGDLYRVRSPSGLPPQTGWGLAKDGRAPPPTLQALPDIDGPSGYIVHGSGCEAANGAYARDGSYASCPLYKQVEDGPYWLLRYRMPKGSHYWYIAHKDQLDRDDGDLVTPGRASNARRAAKQAFGSYWEPSPSRALEPRKRGHCLCVCGEYARVRSPLAWAVPCEERGRLAAERGLDYCQGRRRPDAHHLGVLSDAFAAHAASSGRPCGGGGGADGDSSAVGAGGAHAPSPSRSGRPMPVQPWRAPQNRSPRC